MISPVRHSGIRFVYAQMWGFLIIGVATYRLKGKPDSQNRICDYGSLNSC